ETRREASGLAMSSRNSYLSADELHVAPALQKALQAGLSAITLGSNSDEIDRVMLESLRNTAGVDVDYIRLVDAETFLTPRDLDRDLLLVGAVRVGKTRIIDNVTVKGSKPATQ
ncbi:MAG TPA: pantoate--beta-alanine ligase, partial [Thermoanaerobaculia bacterium]|nr:pantoate--beta-alanine ligase [Thermoanaerobaculia bacterium]